MSDLYTPSLRLTVPKTELNVDTPNRKKYLKNGIPETPKSNILGRGSYGTVIKASYKGENVAVKILKNTVKGKMETMRNEANICGWEHENIIKILKIESTNDCGIIIMERFFGQCLQGILDRIQLPFVHRVYISIDIINALNYCHSRKILHLDVKPQNVLVSFKYNSTKNPLTIPNNKRPSRKYICKLCDFGSSMKMDETEIIKSRVKGTIRYMSPEALKDMTPTSASDIYSFAITMWQLKEQTIPYSWIESNEVVLYKVIKNFLRPDSNDSSRFLNVPKSLQHKDCLCEHYETDSVKISFENIENLENLENIISQASKSLSPFRERNSNVQSNVSNSTKPKISRRFQPDVGNLLQCKRKLYLGNSKTDIKITTDENMLPVADSHIDLKMIFMDYKKTKTGNLLSTEAKFESLYKTCWDDCPETRYAGLKIKKILSDILIKLF